MNELIVKRKSGPLRVVLRLAMRLLGVFFPKKESVRQTTYLSKPMVVWANEQIGRRIILTGKFEDREINQIRKIVMEGDVCIDVGANIGTHAIMLGYMVGCTGAVYAFEPNRANVLLVELNAHLNGLDNVFVQNRPVSAKSGQNLFRAEGKRDSSLDYYRTESSYSERAEPSSLSTTLDDFCSSLNLEPNFLKVDVEGGELLVLLGARRTLAKAKKCVVMVEVVEQYLNRFGHSVQELCGYMSEMGYKPYSMRQETLEEISVSNIAAENIIFIRSEAPLVS